MTEMGASHVFSMGIFYFKHFCFLKNWRFLKSTFFEHPIPCRMNTEQGFQFDSGWMALSAKEEKDWESISQSQRGFEVSVCIPRSVWIEGPSWLFHYLARLDASYFYSDIICFFGYKSFNRTKISFQLRNEILKMILAKSKEENQMVLKNELFSQIRRQVRFINFVISYNRSN